MPLRMLVLSLTGDCNLACRYCYASGQDRRTMTWETARRAIDLAGRAEPRSSSSSQAVSRCWLFLCCAGLQTISAPIGYGRAWTSRRMGH